MPRRIDFDNMKWADARYGRNELGVGGVEIVGDGEYSFSFWYNSGLKNAKEHCGLFSADIQDKDSPRENSNALADEIFSWAEENLRGKWLVFEGFAYRYSVGYQNYVIEDETDRQKFQAQWGHIFEYTEPSAETREPEPLASMNAQNKSRLKLNYEPLGMRHAKSCLFTVIPLNLGFL